MLTQESANQVRTQKGKASRGTRDLSQARLSLDEWEAIWPGCWRRIRSWRVPPRWNRLDWWDEARAEAARAACAAALDYDPTLGVPRAAFLYQRILAGVWTRYRQVWAYGRHLRSPLSVEYWPAPAAPTSPAGDPEEVARLLDQLGGRDRWLIRQFVLGRDDRDRRRGDPGYQSSGGESMQASCIEKLEARDRVIFVKR